MGSSHCGADGNVILILLASGCLQTLVSTTEGQMVGFCNQMDLCNATGVPLKWLVNESPKAACSGAGLGRGDCRLGVPSTFFRHGNWLWHKPDKVMRKK